MLVLLALACTKAPADDSSSAADDSSSTAGPEVTLELSQYGILDSALSADAQTIYFVDSVRLAQIDGASFTEIAAIDDATSLAVDGDTIYVADGKQVLAVSLTEGSSSVVPGSEDTGALAVEYNGKLLVGGSYGSLGAVFSMNGNVTTVLTDALPVPPTGVCGGADGTVYAAAGDSVYAVSGGEATAIATGVHLGEPAGLALTPDDSTLMVSSISDAGTAQVLLINLSDNSTSIFDDVISANHESGGLHRAKDVPTDYAWADRTAGVYRVGF